MISNTKPLESAFKQIEVRAIRGADIHGYHIQNAKSSVLSWHKKELEQANVKTLETISGLLNGDDNQVEVTKNYIFTKLKAKDAQRKRVKL